MNSVRSNNISLKYQRFTTLDSKDIRIIKSEFVAKTQFLFRQSQHHRHQGRNKKYRQGEKSNNHKRNKRADLV